MMGERANVAEEKLQLSAMKEEDFVNTVEALQEKISLLTASLQEERETVVPALRAELASDYESKLADSTAALNQQVLDLAAEVEGWTDAVDVAEESVALLQEQLLSERMTLEEKLLLSSKEMEALKMQLEAMSSVQTAATLVQLEEKEDAFKMEREVKDEALKSSESALSKTTADLREAQSLLIAKEGQVSALEAALESQASFEAAARLEMDSLFEKKVLAESRLKSLEEEVSEQNAVHERALNSLKSLHEEFVKDLSLQLAQAHASMQSALASKNAAEESIASLQEELVREKEVRMTLEERLSFTQDLEAMEEKIEALRSAQSEEKDDEGIKIQLAEKAEELKTMETTLVAVSDQLAGAQSDLQAKDERIHSLEIAYNAALQQQTEWHLELDTLLKEKRSVELQCSSVKEELAESHASIQSAFASRDTAEASIASLQEQLVRESDTRQMLEEKLFLSAQELDAMKLAQSAAILAPREEVDEMARKLFEAQLSLESKRDQICALEAVLNTQASSEAEARSVNHLLKEKLLMSAQELESYRIEMESLKSSFQLEEAKEAALKTMESTLAAMEEKMVAMQRSLEAKDDQIHQCTALLEESKFYKESFESLQLTHLKVMEDLSRQLAEAHVEKAQLQQMIELTDQNSKILLLEAEMATLVQEKASLEERAFLVENQLQEALDQLRREKAVQQTMEEQHTIKLKAKAELEDAQSMEALRLLTSQVEELEDNLKAKEKQLLAVESELETGLKAQALTDQACEEKRRIIEDLQAQVSLYVEENSFLQKELISLQAAHDGSIHVLNLEMAEKHTEISRLKALASTPAALSNQDPKVLSLEAKRMDLVNELSLLERRAVLAEELLAEAKLELHEAQQSARAAETIMDQLKRELHLSMEMKTNEQNHHADEVNKLTAIADDLKQRASVAEQVISTSLKQENSSADTLEALRKKVGQLQFANDISKTEKNEADLKLETLRKEHKLLIQKATVTEETREKQMTSLMAKIEVLESAFYYPSASYFF